MSSGAPAGRPALVPDEDHPSTILPFPDPLLSMEHLGRGPVAQGLMGPQLVVEPEAVFQPPLGLRDVGVGFQVHLSVFHLPPKLIADQVGVSVAKARQWMNVWKAAEMRTPYETIASCLYMSISQIQRLVRAAWVMGVYMPPRTRYEKRKHAGWMHLASWA